MKTRAKLQLKYEPANNEEKEEKNCCMETFSKSKNDEGRGLDIRNIRDGHMINAPPNVKSIKRRVVVRVSYGYL